MPDSMISLINKSIQPMAISPVKPLNREEPFVQPDDHKGIRRQKDNNLDRFEKSDRKNVYLYNNKGKIDTDKKDVEHEDRKNDENVKNDLTPKNPGDKKLSTDEEQELQELKKRDREVKAHEQAHMAAGGGHVRGGAHYEYKTGPDGKNYASGGEVSIDASSGKTPEETINKMAQVKAAALAPANPSDQDRRVAAQADAKAAEARAELMQKNHITRENKAGAAPHTEDNKEDQNSYILNFDKRSSITPNTPHKISSFNAYKQIQQDIPTERTTAESRLHVVA